MILYSITLEVISKLSSIFLIIPSLTIKKDLSFIYLIFAPSKEILSFSTNAFPFFAIVSFPPSITSISLALNFISLGFILLINKNLKKITKIISNLLLALLLKQCLKKLLEKKLINRLEFYLLNQKY